MFPVYEFYFLLVWLFEWAYTRTHVLGILEFIWFHNSGIPKWGIYYRTFPYLFMWLNSTIDLNFDRLSGHHLGLVAFEISVFV